MLFRSRGFPGMSLAILPIEGAAAGGPSAPDSADDSGASELANHTGAAGSANLDDERRAAIHRAVKFLRQKYGLNYTLPQPGLMKHAREACGNPQKSAELFPKRYRIPSRALLEVGGHMEAMGLRIVQRSRNGAVRYQIVRPGSSSSGGAGSGA